MINRLVRSQYTNKDKIDLLEINEKFYLKGIKTLILACTDLQLLKPKYQNVKIHDTMEILAEATVREILK